MKIIAHRGASGLAPENTMSAFKLANEKGADGIELDVHLTSDKHLVIIHDEEIDRTSNGKGSVKDFTLEEIRKFDYGSWFSKDFTGEKIPTLDEFMDWLKTTDMMVNIEIKSSPVASKEDLTKKVLESIERTGLCERVIVSSFDHYLLKVMRETAPHIKIAALYVSNLLDVGEYCKNRRFSFAHPEKDSAHEEMVAECHKNNVGVNVWTVNTKEDARRLEKAGVDAIITNYPNCLV